jgi:flavin-dependent thymidylate synthase
VTGYSNYNDNEGNNSPRSNSVEIQNWVDPAMFEAEKMPDGGPKVHLLWMTPDPLGAAAACNAMYTGGVKRSLADVTHAERRGILGEMAKTILATPLEAVSFHFLIEGVTRAFTHQLVRNRNSSFSQESMRFAVVGEKQDIPVALPPSLAGGRTKKQVLSAVLNSYPSIDQGLAKSLMLDEATDIDKARWSWDEANAAIQETYHHLINSGIPAEDARGLLPTNVKTRIHWVVNLRSLKLEAGKRLSTQAQFEWKAVIAGIARAIREHSPHAAAIESMIEAAGGMDTYDADFLRHLDESDRWQYEGISDLFRPICYQTGKCEFMASIDRSCTIRDRVEANHAIGRPSSLWHKDLYEEVDAGNGEATDGDLRISAISPEEWLSDPTAAR